MNANQQPSEYRIGNLLNSTLNRMSSRSVNPHGQRNSGLGESHNSFSTSIKMSQTVNERQLALIEILGLSLYELALKEKPDLVQSQISTIQSRWVRKPSATKTANAIIASDKPKLLNQPNYQCGLGSFQEFSTGIVVGSSLSQVHNM